MKRKIERGQPLTEMVKGSLEYTQHLIRRAFYRQFRDQLNEFDFWIEEIFTDYAIVSQSNLPPDEFYYVSYTFEGDTFVFAPREQWEVVELTYQLKATNAMAESRKNKSNRLVERMTAALELTEAAAAPNPDGPWPIRAVGITADVVNGNGRRYAGYVLDTAVREMQGHIHESAGQGRLILTGEIDHPADKGNPAALLQETVINWQKVEFDGQHVLLEGQLLGTSKGKDLRAMMLAGVKPDISQRGYGQSIMVKEGNESIQDVIELHLTGYDPVLVGSDPDGQAMLESNQSTQEVPPRKEIKPMDPELIKAIEQFITVTCAALPYSEAVRAQLVAEVRKMNPKSVDEVKSFIETKRKEYDTLMTAEAQQRMRLMEAAGVDAGADLPAVLETRNKRLAELEEAERNRQVAGFVEKQAKELKYPDWLQKQFVEAIQAKTVDEAKQLIAAKRKEYDAIMSTIALAAKGMNLEVLGPVIESELGIPAFARPAFELTERLTERHLAVRRDLREAVTPNAMFTRRYLEAFDRAYRDHLLEENRKFEAWHEAETVSDLSLPYSVSRAIIEEAFPELIALSVFDFGLEDSSPSRIYFEAYAEESGASAPIANEAFTSDLDTWVSLAHKRLRGSPAVTVTSSPAGTTFTEYDDYVIDYGNGKIMVLTSGSMADSTGYLVNYTYDAVREGENQAIQRGKGTLSYQTIELKADRLASLVTDEAVTFARTQLGWDAVARTLNMVIREIREMIDGHIMRLAVANAVRAANNGGTWTYATTDAALDELVLKMGAAKVSVINDHYMPGFFLLSMSNAEILSNWKGFTREGFPNAVLDSAGFVGAVKGLPVFQSAQLPDSHIIVAHRELVQHRVLASKPMTMRGPFQAYSSGSLVAAQEYYIEEYNATESLLPNKGGYVTVA